jgi:hypothetical protein
MALLVSLSSAFSAFILCMSSAHEKWLKLARSVSVHHLRYLHLAIANVRTLAE